MVAAGLSDARTRSTVWARWLNPSKAKNSHCKRNKDRVGGNQTIECEQTQAGWAVDKDDVELHQICSHVSQAKLPLGEADELDFRTGKFWFGRDNREIGHLGRPQAGLRRLAADKTCVATGCPVVAGNVYAGGRISLRVKVDDEHAEPVLREGGGDIEHGRSFADAALLVRNGDDVWPGCVWPSGT